MIEPRMPTRNDLSKTAEEFFREGNYTNAALVAEESSWVKYAALALIGHPGALRTLEDFSQQEDARFYLGVSHWIQGNDEQALTTLKTVHREHSERLCLQIERPVIPVLLQSPWAARNNVFYPARLDRKFQVTAIGPMDNARPSIPYADISQYYEAHNRPLFFHTIMLEWQHLPVGLNLAPFPTFARTSDFDLHVQTILPLLNCCDAILTHDGTEFQSLKPMVKRPVYTFPKSFGLNAMLPALTESKRDYDMLFSGTVLHPYHQDKATVLSPILDAPDLKIQFSNRFLSDAEYYRNLARSRMAFSYVRWTGGWSTRALESFAMGCYTLVQEKSVLTLFFGPEDGVATYDWEQNNLLERMRGILADWPRYSQAAYHGAQRARTEWTATKCISQNLRFMSYLATDPGFVRASHCAEEPMRKRGIIYLGWHYPYEQHNKELYHRNITRCIQSLSSPTVSTHSINDLIREMTVFHCAHRLAANGVQVSPWMQKEVYDLCHQGLGIFPRCLVLRFNYIRASIHNGGPDDVSLALMTARATVTQSIRHWIVDPMEDIMSWDFAPEFFDYRGYFDHCCRILSGHESGSESLIRLIYSSLFRYLAAYSNLESDFRRAVEYCPEYAWYRMSLAAYLMRNGERESLHEAGELLKGLCEDSILMPRAITALKVLVDAGHYPSPEELSDWQLRLSILDSEGLERGLDMESPLPLRPARA